MNVDGAISRNKDHRAISAVCRDEQIKFSGSIVEDSLVEKWPLVAVRNCH
jgi:hypothetical protein